MSGGVEVGIDIIIEEYSGYVFKIVSNISKNLLTIQDMEEIVSDTFYLFWRNQDKIKTNIKSYLGAIARNSTYDRLRKLNITLEYMEELDTSYNPIYDDIIIVKDKLNKLSLEEKKVFLYYYLDGYKVKEISKMLNKSVSDIKIKLYRIRKKLREELKNG